MKKTLTIKQLNEFAKEENLLKTLGDFPSPPFLQVDTLESVQLETGWRHKIEYLAEEADLVFATPADKIRAYLFVPNHNKGEKLPAIIAIHQHGREELYHLGKLETAGLGGEDDQHYGLELFQRRYVVICTDRYTHGERRRIKAPITTESDKSRSLFLVEQRNGQLILSGRTTIGKMAYDLILATNVLCSLDYVDQARIGAIGHSGGGLILPYFMFADKRIKVGASSCGVNELLEMYNQNEPPELLSCLALPGLAKIGRSADYVAFLAPRPFLMTRGLWEYDKGDETQRLKSKEHVAETKRIEEHARQRYRELNVSENLRVIYFEENNGYHSFPPGVKQQVYQWLDSHLKPGYRRE
jgi:dienelactone hydrolase